MDPIVVGITGGSGSAYGIRLLQQLRELEVETHLVVTQPGLLTLSQETDWTSEQVRDLASTVHPVRNVGASIASGSFRTQGMVVVPCSIKTLSGIALSYADNLLTRAADVTLKERRPLVLVVREAPLHLGHLRLMTAAAEIGATILPPCPAMYTRPLTVEDIVDNTVGRILDQLGLDTGMPRWAGTSPGRDVAPEDAWEGVAP